MAYRYFDTLSFPGLLDSYTGSQGFVAYRPWEGGFNNIRMSYELAACLAFLLNKTLVLPLPYTIYLLDKHAGLDHYFDMSDTGVKTLSLQEYARQRGIEPTYQAVALTADQYDRSDMGHSCYKLVDGRPPSWFPHHRAIVDLERFRGGTSFFDGQLLGTFYQTIYTLRMGDLKRLVAKHIRLRGELFDAAYRCARRMPAFGAMHVRRGDFQYKDKIPTQEDLLRTSRIFPADTPLYIATDERDKSWFEPLAKRHRLYFYDDVCDYVEPSWVPMVEQLICAQATKFLQAPYSTFSSYIFRLRGYMQAADVKHYTTQEGETPQHAYHEEQRFDSNWVREYRDGFDFGRAY